MKFSPIAVYLYRAVALFTLLLAASDCLAADPESSGIPKSIRVVMDDNYPPYVFKGDQGELKGIIVDQWGLWEKKTGIHVEITGMDWSEAQRRMQAGEFDVIDTIFRNEKRDKIYDFTKPYAVIPVPLFFQSDISGIRGPGDARGFMVAAKAGGNVLDVLRQNGVTDIVEYPSYEKIIEAARDGKVKVFTVDRPAALYYLNKMGIQNRFRETRPLYYGEFHRAVLKGQTGLLAVVENGFASIAKADYTAIDERWLGSSIQSSPYFHQVLYGAGVFAALVSFLSAWLWILRRAVAGKTRELKESEEHHRSILQTAMNGIWLVDMRGRLVEVNKSYCTMSGYSEQELLVMRIPDLVVDESEDDITDRLLSVKERGEAQFESRHRRRNGTVFDVEVRIKYYPAFGGQYVAFLQDITERKRNEEIIINSNKLLQAIINNAPMRIFWKDTELRYLGCNQVFAEDAGVGCPDDLIGKDDYHLVWKELAELYRTDDLHVIESGMPIISYEEPQTTADGNQIVLRTSKVPLYNEADEIIGVLGIYEDITGRKQVEEEKLALEQQLQHSQKLESLGVLAGGIAHDFNNILAIIMGHCSLAELDSNKAGNHIPPISKAAERAAGLCRQMLVYAGKASFTPTQVDLPELVREMVTMLKATTNQNVVIKLDLPADMPAITGDASQIRQIVMNLIINASEAIGEAHGVIHVTLSEAIISAGLSERDFLGNTLPPGRYACLAVSDTGCGMDDETRRRIFEPFYTTKFTGRGLGMSAVLGIIKAHGGALQLASTHGRGSAFTVYLPVQSGEAAVEAPQQRAAPEPWRGSGMILLVEDEAQVLFVAKEMLEELGFTVIEASNGMEALALYREKAADVTMVLTDMGMPVMDGYALIRELKKLNPKLPIIITSGFGDADLTARIPCEDIAGLVGKPYNFNQLQEVLKSVKSNHGKPACQ